MTRAPTPWERRHKPSFFSELELQQIQVRQLSRNDYRYVAKDDSLLAGTTGHGIRNVRFL